MKKSFFLVLLTLCFSSILSAQSSKGKTLVVYYSATGTTEFVAKKIADITDAALFEIEPSTPYTDADLDWTDNKSRCVKEHNDTKLRNVPLKNTTVPDWSSYDTVYIGYPIWWGIAAWPLDTFIKANDFSGKKVIPFCTAISSGVGRSDTLLRDMAKTGNWTKGEIFRRNATTDRIKTWIEGIR